LIYFVQSSSLTAAQKEKEDLVSSHEIAIESRAAETNTLKEKHDTVSENIFDQFFINWYSFSETRIGIVFLNIQELSPGQTRKHCCGNTVSYQCFAMFPRVGKH
jgi:hypothetical protein